MCVLKPKVLRHKAFESLSFREFSLAPTRAARRLFTSLAPDPGGARTDRRLYERPQAFGRSQQLSVFYLHRVGVPSLLCFRRVPLAGHLIFLETWLLLV